MTKRSLIAMIFIIAILIPVNVFCQGTFENLKLEVAAEKTEVLLGEPIKLDLEVLNSTNSKIKFESTLDAEYGFIRVLVANSKDGIYKEYRHPRWGVECGAMIDGVEIEAGAKVETKLNLLYNTIMYGDPNALQSEYIFSDEGSYYLKVVVSDSNYEKEIESKPLLISVSLPRNDEAEVWEVLKKNEWGRFYQIFRSKDLRKTIDSLNKILKDYPDSVYAPHIKDAYDRYVKMYNAIQKTKVKWQEVSEGSKQKTLREIEALLTKWADSWDRKDYDKMFSCYYDFNPSRKAWLKGGEDKAKVEAELSRSRKFGNMKVSILEPIHVGKYKVLLKVKIKFRKKEEIQPVMEFARNVNSSEWKILHEGF